MGKYDIIAKTAFGLEALVTKELRYLGYSNTTVENGKVMFEGDELAIARANLWLRTAGRVVIKVAEFEATTFDELFDQTKAIPWYELLPKQASFPVVGKSVKSQLSSVPACQSVVKKAIVESMKEHYGLEWFKESGENYTIEVALHKDVVTLTLDTSGASLHKRGYRDLTAAAPLKETLAAAIIDLSRWEPHRQLVDPTCGSGTIPIEAAMIAKNIAPGLSRSFACEDWPWFEDKFWKEAREEARDLIKRDVEFRCMGYDINGDVLKLARHHAERAGVAEHTDFHKLPVAELSSNKKYGCVICNPPYGERLSNKREVIQLYREMGQVFKTLGDGTWSFFVLTSMQDFEKQFGTRANKKRKLFNGRLRVDLYQYFGPLPPRNFEK